MRIYLDSNVFISLFETEVGRNVRGLFVEAEQFLERVKEQNHILVLSDLFFEEVRQRSYMNESEVMAYFEEQDTNVEIVRIKPGLPWRKFATGGLHSSDALHVAAAIEGKCDCIVTFNIKDFKKAKKEIRVFEPAEFG